MWHRQSELASEGEHTDRVLICMNLVIIHTRYYEKFLTKIWLMIIDAIQLICVLWFVMKQISFMWAKNFDHTYETKWIGIQCN